MAIAPSRTPICGPHPSGGDLRISPDADRCAPGLHSPYAACAEILRRALAVDYTALPRTNASSPAVLGYQSSRRERYASASLSPQISPETRETLRVLEVLRDMPVGLGAHLRQLCDLHDSSRQPRDGSHVARAPGGPIGSRPVRSRRVRSRWGRLVLPYPRRAPVRDHRGLAAVEQVMTSLLDHPLMPGC